MISHHLTDIKMPSHCSLRSLLSPLLVLFVLHPQHALTGSMPMRIPRPPPSWSSTSSSLNQDDGGSIPFYNPHTLSCAGDVPPPNFYGWPEGYHPWDYETVEDLCAYKPNKFTTLGTICLMPTVERSHVCLPELSDRWLWESEPLRHFCWASCWCVEEEQRVRDERIRYARYLAGFSRPSGWDWNNVNTASDRARNYAASETDSDDGHYSAYQGGKQAYAQFARQIRALDLMWARLHGKESPAANLQICRPGRTGETCRAKAVKQHFRPKSQGKQPPPALSENALAIAQSRAADKSCGTRCQARADGSFGCASSALAACACTAMVVAQGLWEMQGCRAKGLTGSRLGGKIKRRRALAGWIGGRGEGAEEEVEQEWACPCNASYVSKGCCGSGNGMVWEGREAFLGELRA